MTGRRVVAVTGATGFVGGHLLKATRAAGYEVRALTRGPRPAEDGVIWIEGALDQPEALAALCQDVDAIIHVAGLINGPDREAFDAVNAGGTANMIEAARAAGVRRFIHMSSLAAREPDLSDYGWSKARAEQVVAASGLDWTMVRPPGIYGPEDTEMLDLFRMARRGLVLLPPAGRISVIEVSDLARLLLALIPDEESVAQIYEADDGMEGGWTHNSFARAIGWAVGKRVSTLAAPKRLLTIASRLDRTVRRSKAKLTQDRVNYFSHPDWVVDPAKRPPASLWEPQINTRAGLKATAAWYRRNGWLG